MYKEHPLRILRYSVKNLWLLIFPFLRLIFVVRFDPARIYEWVQGTWIDIAVLGVILVFGFIRWYFSRIIVDEDAIIHKSGLFLKVRTIIPFKSISTVTTEQPFYLIPFLAYFFCCDTRSGIFKSTDLKVMVTKRVRDELMSHVPDIDDEMQIKDIPGPSLISIILFSVFFSSGFTGAVYIAAFFYKGGDMAHEVISMVLSRITETTEMLTQRLIRGIPHAAVAFGTFFIAAWLLSFIMNLLRYLRFNIKADNKLLAINCGIINRRQYRLRLSHINYADLRQNLLMKALKAVTVGISCAGYGNGSKHLPVLFPIQSSGGKDSLLKRLGFSTGNDLMYRPRWDNLLTYTSYPIILLNLIFVLYYYSDRLLEYLSTIAFFIHVDGLIPLLGDISTFLAIMLAIPAVWLIAVKTAALFFTGISIEGERVTICTSKWTTFHTINAKRSNVVLVEIYRNPWQRLFNNKAHLKLYLAGESKTVCRIYGLRLRECEEIAMLLEDRG